MIYIPRVRFEDLEPFLYREIEYNLFSEAGKRGYGLSPLQWGAQLTFEGINYALKRNVQLDITLDQIVLPWSNFRDKKTKSPIRTYIEEFSQDKSVQVLKRAIDYRFMREWNKRREAKAGASLVYGCFRELGYEKQGKTLIIVQ